MERTADERSEWVGITAFLLGAAVIVPSLIVLAVTVITVLLRLV
ncbi:hypothetical protein GCM10011385_19930 [Nitratireductor aestuarii]|jgi:hypothetical protein|uniref:Uncharacterized protein n=1 Tax=Nitratireductor aestuarii TaxID=1735103 RepID=A0A916RQD1_9HYPH|nr:hypothetical protein [Nitratireductor aestuarii]GGA66024.1 hypothetical protein GCM10011385_19930 [Nitratireductor aestuarii]